MDNHVVIGPTTLADLLENTLILGQIVPCLPVPSALALSATSKALRSIICHSSETFRYLNISLVKSAIPSDSSPIDGGGISWRSERMDESLTEDDFYSGPLRGIFSKLHRQHLLLNVKTLILDGLSVPAELVMEMIADDRFNVKIISIRQVQNLNQGRLQQVLKYMCRPSAPRPPKLKGLYVFGSKDASPLPKSPVPERHLSRPIPSGVMSSEGAQIGAQWNSRSEAALSSALSQPQDDWWKTKGKVMRAPSSDWADTLIVCQGTISFDAVLCRGPRHDRSNTDADKLLAPAVANIALGTKGCDSCGTCPEQPAVFNQDPSWCFPLLAPPPMQTSTVRAAQRPIMQNTEESPSLILRCEDCLRERFCEKCHKWWCEDCYEEPVSRARRAPDQPDDGLQQDGQWIAEALGGNAQGSSGPVKGVHRDCIGCGRTCIECKAKCIRRCRECGNEYCLEDNEGSSATTCDWCRYSGRRTRELY